MGPGGGEPNLVLYEALVKYGCPDRKANSLLIDLAPKQFPRDLFRAANDWLSQDLERNITKPPSVNWLELQSNQIIFQIIYSCNQLKIQQRQ